MVFWFPTCVDAEEQASSGRTTRQGREHTQELLAAWKMVDPAVLYMPAAAGYSPVQDH